MTESELDRQLYEAAESTEPDQVLTRRQYLTRKMLLKDVSIWMAMEAVSSTAIAHPEMDMDEERTWAEWEAAE